MKDFFISYQQRDLDWAVWIDQTLRIAGFSTVFQHRDFEVGADFVAEIDEALIGSRCTIAVLSEAYLQSWWTRIECDAALARMRHGGRLIPVKVGPVTDLGVLAAISHVDLVGMSAVDGAGALLQALSTAPRAATTVAGPMPAERTGRRSVTNIPHLRNQFFVGRDDVLDVLAGQYSASAGDTAIDALFGMGGVGKSQIAIEYAQRQAHRFGIRLWIDAHDEEALRAGFAASARAVGLQPNPAETLRDLVAALTEVLAARPSWLLILDNVEDIAMVRPCIPACGAGQVVITTRLDDAAALGVAHPLEIVPLTATESRAFFLRRTRRDAVDTADAAALDALVGELDGLPLALEQAGAYISQTRARFDAYLASLRRGRLELLERGKPLAGPYAGTVGTTWRINLEHIETEWPAAAELLRLCAFLASDPLPLEPLARAATTDRFSLAGALEQMILAPGDWRYTHVLGSALHNALRNADVEPLRVYELVAPLVRYSLMRVDAAHDAIIVHRVLQDVVRAAVGTDDGRLWAGRALEMVDLVFPRTAVVGASVSAEADALLPHAMTAIGHARRLCPDDGHLPWLLEVTGCYLLARGSPSRAVPLLVECARLIEAKFGPDAQRLAVALHNLGTAYNELGRYNDAEQALRRALRIREAPEATDELARAKPQDALGNLLVRRGQPLEAEPLHRSALSAFERISGPNSHLVATSCQFLSNCAVALGRRDKAHALNERSVAIYRQVLSPTSPELATALYNLGVSSPQPSEALNHLQEARRIYEIALGPDHLWVARVDGLMAMHQSHLGNPAAAEPLFANALAVFDRELPRDHLETAGLLTCLAETYNAAGRPAEAVAPLERAHASLAHHLGTASRPAIHALGTLAQSLYDSHQFERGVPLARALINAMTEAGADALSRATAWTLCGAMLQGMSRHAEAQHAHEQALALLKDQPSAAPGFLATTLSNIASTHHGQDHADEAERGYRQALELFARAAPDDPNRMVCATNFAQMLRSAGRNDEAARIEAEPGSG